MTGQTSIKRDRNLAIREMYKRGMTLAEIGGVVGVSRQRVQQIISCYYGMDASDGGRIVKGLKQFRPKADAEREKTLKAEAKFFDKFGCSVEFVRCLSSLAYTDKKHPIFKWRQQRTNARRRGIPFCLTFKQWWDIWAESGKWDQRGRGFGYCMARYGDSGGYSVDNVYVCSCGENASDSYLIHSAAERTEKRRKTLEARAQ